MLSETRVKPVQNSNEATWAGNISDDVVPGILNLIAVDSN